MTTTPMEPDTQPEIVPSGDPGLDPTDPGQAPDAPIPETSPSADL